MSIKKILVSLIAGAVMTTAFALSAIAADALGGANFDSNAGVVFDGTNYYASLAEAVKGVHGADAVLYCKPDADLGSMTHGHVCNDLTVYGNGAYLSGGEQDFEIDQPSASGTSCAGLTGDITVRVDNLTGAGLWGTKSSEHTVNAVFTNCEALGKVYITGTAGEVNITLENCTFTGNDVSGCKVYSNTYGTITLDNVDFSGVDQPVALNNKSTGTQTIIMTDCDFDSCGAASKDYTVPVSVKSSVDGGTSVLTVDNCTFTGTVTNSIGQDADILLDYGVGKTDAVIKNTAGKVGVETASNEASYTETSKDKVYVADNKTEEAKEPVAKIGEKLYTSIQTAVDAAEENNVIVVLDNITAEVLPTADSSNHDASAFIHTDKDDVITLDLNGKTISVKGADEAKYDTLAIRNIGNLTITDTSDAKTGKITLAFDGTQEVGSSQIHSTILNYGTLTINGGTIENTATTGYSPYAIYNYSWGGNAVLTINDGVISSERTYAVIQAIYDDFSKNNNFVTVNGGTINGGLYSWYQGACLDAALKINGGTFNAGTSTEALRVRTSGTFAMPVVISDAAVINGATRIQAAADVNGKYYANIKTAFEAAQNGEKVKLLGNVTLSDVLLYADRNGKTWNGSYAFDFRINKDITLDLNGYTIKSTGGSDSQPYAIFCVDGAGKLTVEDTSAEKTGKIICAATAPGRSYNVVLYNEAGDIVLNGGTFINSSEVEGLDHLVIDSVTAGDTSLVINDGAKLISNKDEFALIVRSQGGAGTQNVNINGGEVEGGIWVVLKNGGNDVMNFTVTDGTFTANEDALVVSNYAAPADGATADDVSIAGGTFYGNVRIGTNTGNLLSDGFISGGLFSNDVNEYTTADFAAVPQYNGMYAIVDENLAVEAIEVKFKDVTATDAEGEKLYNINLVATDEDIINRLNSADLTFKLTSVHDMAYTIIASNDEIKINPVNNSDDRYEFHFNGKTDVETDTANTITIGQVKFEGYGEYDFEIVADAPNAVHATTLYDNIVDTFVPNGEDGVQAGELIVTDKIDGDYIAVPTRNLIINVDFPNSVEEQTIAYNDMKVVVSGGDLAEAITIDLGSDAVETEIETENDKADAKYFADFVDGAYVVTVTDVLTLNNSYNVEVSGAGYRTARYTVTMNCEEYKTLNFWNNVKDNAVEVEEKKDSSKKNVTFLAGDIVKDSVINIYDLSAVVSYFGEIDLNKSGEYNAYAKYDLNRDGKIDSMDVAYVLVSWGK